MFEMFWLVKAPGLLLGFLSRNRFYRWGVFMNRFLKAHIKRMLYQVSDQRVSARIEAGRLGIVPNALKEPANYKQIKHQIWMR